MSVFLLSPALWSRRALGFDRYQCSFCFKSRCVSPVFRSDEGQHEGSCECRPGGVGAAAHLSGGGGRSLSEGRLRSWLAAHCERQPRT